MRKQRLTILIGLILVVAVALGLRSVIGAPSSLPSASPDTVSEVSGLASTATVTPLSPTIPPIIAAPPAGSSPPAARQDVPLQQPAPTPAREATLSVRGGPRPTLEEEFIDQYAAAAQASQRETGVPAAVTLAQAGLESDWGRSRLAREGNNYFGIKATARPGTAGVIRLPTQESLGGKNVTIVDAFRAYHSPEESFIDHGRFFLEGARYAQAIRNKGDARAFARSIHAAGYATDPGYSDKLIRLMDRLDLYRFDLPVTAKPPGG